MEGNNCLYDNSFFMLFTEFSTTLSTITVENSQGIMKLLINDRQSDVWYRSSKPHVCYGRMKRANDVGTQRVDLEQNLHVIALQIDWLC